MKTGQGATKRLHARILLKADGHAAGRGWAGAESAEALETRASTVQRVRQAWADRAARRLGRVTPRSGDYIQLG